MSKWKHNTAVDNKETVYIGTGFWLRLRSATRYFVNSNESLSSSKVGKFLDLLGLQMQQQCSL